MTVTLTLGLSLGALLTGCPKTPDYPACKKDKHCEDGESCVDGLCQNCKADSDCEGGMTCTNFRCEPPTLGAGCETNDACDIGLICLEGTCQSCSDDSQCESNVCLESGRCEPLPCATDDECPIDEICDGGQCIYSPLDSGSTDAVCGVEALYFAFDSAKLSPGNQEQLTQAAACLVDLLQGGGELVLEAHADNVGTEEYNILLTDRRGTTVREFLAGAGVPDDRMRVVGKGALQAQGGDEAGRTKDRRVVFIIEGQ